MVRNVHVSHSFAQYESIIVPICQLTKRYQSATVECESPARAVIARIFGRRVDIERHHAVTRMRESRRDRHAAICVRGNRESDRGTSVPSKQHVITGDGISRTGIVVQFRQAVE